MIPEEIHLLKAQGNRAREWDSILVAPGFLPDCVWNNLFVGKCVLGVFTGGEIRVDDSVSLPTGVYGSTIIETEIGDDCLISGVGALANYLVREHSVVYRTDSLIASGNCTFGNGTEIAVGIETGGREVLSFAEITIPLAAAVATRRGDEAFLAGYIDFVRSYVEACKSSWGIVESGGIIRNTTRVEDTYVGGGVLIDGAALVKNCTVLGTEEEPVEISDGAFVRNSCLQWGCEVTSMGIVDDSVLTEHSHVERHGKVTQSIIGPNSGIAEGEVTACLVGPFVGFHHQALLIAAIWPEGKGNVGYGANVGSNHTSKAPDQEIWCGEGTFFGLGVNIKFPSDFSGAPYSIIATGVDTLPQKLEFPFSLINKPGRSLAGVSPAFNEIFPGWVLSDNIYTVKRNEGKYKKRNRARRADFAFDVFRPETIDPMVRARNRLRDPRVAVPKDTKYYTSKDIPGLGKNVLTEDSRKRGIDAYQFYIEYYSLRGLMERIASMLEQGKAVTSAFLYDTESDDPLWEHQRRLLKAEGYHRRSPGENLKRLVEMQERVAADTEQAKVKDDIRGRKIIPDYLETCTQAPDDGFVKQTWEETAKFRDEVESLIDKLD